MDYNRAARFVRVVKHGSFTAAAEELGIPKSSVSRSISQLERDLGVRLLHRTTRKLSLTDAGQAYYDAVVGAVAALDEAESAARERGAEPRGPVRISLLPDLDANDLAAALARFNRRHPAIRLELSFSSRRVDLVAEGFDLAVRAGKLEDSSLVGRRIGATDVALFAAPSYLRRRGRPRTIDELSEHDFVLYRAQAGRSTLHLTGPDGERSVEVTGPLVSDQLGFCAAATVAGIGMALLPTTFVLETARDGQLETVLPGWVGIGATLNVVMPSARQLPARVALVRDFLVEHLKRKLDETNARAERARVQRS